MAAKTMQFVLHYHSKRLRGPNAYADQTLTRARRLRGMSIAAIREFAIHSVQECSSSIAIKLCNVDGLITRGICEERTSWDRERDLNIGIGRSKMDAQARP